MIGRHAAARRGRLARLALAALAAVGVCLSSLGSSAAAATTSALGAVQATSSQDPHVFSRDMTLAQKTVQSYWANQFEAAEVPFEPISRIFSYTSGTAKRYTCAGVPLIPRNALYCADGDFIAYDGPWVESQYKQLGHAFVFMLMGHEYGHRIQVLQEIPFSTSRELELSADCLAGAYLGDSVRADVLQEERDDVRTLTTALTVAGDPPGTPWFAPGSHGTAEQRVAAFSNGYDGGLEAC